MRTFKATLIGMLIKELKIIFGLVGKLTISLSVFSYVDIIELNSQLNVAEGYLLFIGLGAYLISFFISKLYLVLQSRYDKSKGI